MLGEIGNIINAIILIVLGLDSLRMIIAMLGIVKRETPFFGRIIYGKYDAIVLKETLREMGYGRQQTERIVGKVKNVVREDKYPKKDAALKLIYLLSQYIDKFDNTISYGLVSDGKQLSYSNYYINTMEAVHNNGVLKSLSHIMIQLMKYNKENKIDFIIVPKGGNPLFAQQISSELGVSLILAKDQNDSAKPQGKRESMELGLIKYEGLKHMLDKYHKGKLNGIVLDCNTSGGTQLSTIINEFNELIKKCDYPIKRIKKCYVLFKLVKVDQKSGREVNIDKRFSDLGVRLYRFFDLDEEDKRQIYGVSSYIDYYEAYNSEELHNIRKNIKTKSKYYYR